MKAKRRSFDETCDGAASQAIRFTFMTGRNYSITYITADGGLRVRRTTQSR